MSVLQHCAFGRAEKLLKWKVLVALGSSKEVLFLDQICSHIYLKSFLCDSLMSWLILLCFINIGFRRYNLYDNEGNGNVLVYGVYLGIRKDCHINTLTVPPNMTLYFF